MATAKRFAAHTDDEIKKKQCLLTPKNTRKCNDKAERAFQAYLTEVGEPKRILELEVDELDKHLKGFWFSLRKIPKEEDGENAGLHYKASSLDNMRYSLKRFFQENGKKFDITKDTEFSDSRGAFKSAMTELKEMGLGSTAHHKEITQEGKV